MSGWASSSSSSMAALRTWRSSFMAFLRALGARIESSHPRTSTREMDAMSRVANLGPTWLRHAAS